MSAVTPDNRVRTDAPEIVMLHLDDLEPDPDQGRRRLDTSALDGLAKSIKECGILEPILVAPRAEGGKHRIIAGERRWRAARIAELEKVPCIVRDHGRPALDQLVENFQREDLDVIAKAAQIRRTMAQTGLDAKEVAAKAGLSFSAVQKYLRLADGPEVLRKAVSIGLRVKVGSDEQTRVLDWTHGLEALRIYNTIFEPVDPTEKKLRANMRLEALLRRALKEDWTRVRWLACATSMGRERHKDRGASVPEPEAKAVPPSGSSGSAVSRSTPEPDGRAAVTPNEAAVPTGDLLELIGRALPTASREAVLAAAAALDAAAADLDGTALFARRDETLVIYLAALGGSGDAVRRSALIREVDAVLASVRRLAPAASRRNC